MITLGIWNSEVWRAVERDTFLKSMPHGTLCLCKLCAHSTLIKIKITIKQKF